MLIRTRLFEIEIHAGLVYVRLGRADACYRRDGTRYGQLTVGRWFVW